ncbi:hypothetical protein KSF_100790 [Reticulibacter mediterranei]|uniref:Uncharacterized protein n=1 Tax=Reticulibacter mediterranei TaxID=2778369 RepID=A0A8J3ISL1_9CHLR|nr:hypothetical protein [Reticulibacter mediterranei]GHP00032.1 hypothetical protein KSF_100790 [Reticulibacter mediterranei]
MQPDSTFLTQATTAGQRRSLDDQRRGIILSPPQVLQLAQDFAGLALVQERLTHPNQAAQRAALRAEAFAEGYATALPAAEPTTTLPNAPALPAPRSASSPRHRAHAPRRRTRPARHP